HSSSAAVKRAANRQAPACGDRIHLGWTFVAGGKRDRPSIGRERGPGFFTQSGGQSPGDSALGPDRPKSALSRRDDGVSIDGGEPVVTSVLLRQTDADRCRYKEKGAYESSHGG